MLIRFLRYRQPRWIGRPTQPPVNLYGAHIRASQDFTIRAIMKNVHAQASLSLYGSVRLFMMNSAMSATAYS